LRAAQQLERRILVLFQPHRYSRTGDLLSDFASSFGLADFLGVLDIYGAGEPPIEGSLRAVGRGDSARRTFAGHVFLEEGGSNG
jgi:UDP-N-acetylmuramate-alanine ligase